MKILFIIESRAQHMMDCYSDDRLMAEHLSRGHDVWASEPIDLVVNEGTLYVHAYRYHRQETSISFIDPAQHRVNDFDFIYFRAMPPVEKDVLLATYLMNDVNIPICNAPAAIRNLNEKLNALQFASFMPPTLISAHPEDILAFAGKVGWPLVLKPLDGFQSKGVLKIDTAEEMPVITQLMMAQPYLKEVEKTGSKRVFILKGKFIGAISFLPDLGDFRTNFGRVPSYAATSLSDSEALACQEIGAHLLKEGVSLAALDFIDNYLLEINITCPGGIPEYDKQYGVKLEAIIVDGLISRK